MKAAKAGAEGRRGKGKQKHSHGSAEEEEGTEENGDSDEEEEEVEEEVEEEEEEGGGEDNAEDEEGEEVAAFRVSQSSCSCCPHSVSSFLPTKCVCAGKSRQARCEREGRSTSFGREAKTKTDDSG